MKIFAVYSELVMEKQPLWLKDFRSKYDESYHLHVTYIQPRFIEEDEVQNLKNKLSDFFSKQDLPKEIRVIFEDLTIDKGSKGLGVIMINSKENSALSQLQKAMRESLANYDNYCKERSKLYEANFKPHITIARDLDDETLQLAQNDLKKDFQCEGVIKEVILSVVNEDTPEEAKNPANKTIYKF